MNLSDPLPEKGVAIPIYATFTGVKGIPIWALGVNSASPILRFYPDEVEFRVIRRHVRPWTSVERVDLWRGRRTNTLTFDWLDARLNFSANVIRPDWMWQCVSWCARREMTLSERAKAFLAQGCPDLSRPG